MKNLFNFRNLLLLAVILLAAATRLLPNHIANVSPILAIALFGGVYFKNKIAAYLLPLASMVLSDMIIGFHPLIWAVYLSFALVVLLGQLISGNASTGKIVFSSLAGSAAFFIITNFAHWMMFFPIHNAGTLVQCYIDAVPFFRNAIFGDLAYVAVLFGGFSLAERFIPSLRDELSIA